MRPFFTISRCGDHVAHQKLLGQGGVWPVKKTFCLAHPHNIEGLTCYKWEKIQ